MASDYLSVLVFIIFSLLFPASMLMLSKLVRNRDRQNPVSTLNFESSEQTIGKGLSIMKEYFHYFASFLAFEIVAGIVLVWAVVSGSLPTLANYAVLGFAVLCFALELASMLIATRRE